MICKIYSGFLLLFPLNQSKREKCVKSAWKRQSRTREHHHKTAGVWDSHDGLTQVFAKKTNFWCDTLRMHAILRVQEWEAKGNLTFWSPSSPQGRSAASAFLKKLIKDSASILWLVVWNMAFMTFHILGIITPTDFHIFQRGWNHQPDSLEGSCDVLWYAMRWWGSGKTLDEPQQTKPCGWKVRVQPAGNGTVSGWNV